MERYADMREYVRKAFQKPGSHGFDHSIRVTALCWQIGEAEKANMDILIPAALFHDIARPLEEETGIRHEIEGARIADQYLTSIHYSSDYTREIVHAIQTHRFTTNTPPLSLEAKILSDADKLDAMGAVGIARAFMTAGERGGDIQDGIYHIHEKLLQLLDLLYTTTSREFAMKRHRFLLDFLSAFHEETDRAESMSLLTEC